MNLAVTYSREKMQEPAETYAFARQTADQIIEAVGEYRRADVNINVYTPRRVAGERSNGVIVLAFTKSGAPPARIGIEFGQTDGAGNVVRFGFDREAWEEFPNEPHSGGVNAFDFDEAWRIVCLVGADLEAVQVTISYGL